MAQNDSQSGEGKEWLRMKNQGPHTVNQVRGKDEEPGPSQCQSSEGKDEEPGPSHSQSGEGKG